MIPDLVSYSYNLPVYRSSTFLLLVIIKLRRGFPEKLTDVGELFKFLILEMGHIVFVRESYVWPYCYVCTYLVNIQVLQSLRGWHSSGQSNIFNGVFHSYTLIGRIHR